MKLHSDRTPVRHHIPRQPPAQRRPEQHHQYRRKNANRESPPPSLATMFQPAWMVRQDDEGERVGSREGKERLQCKSRSARWACGRVRHKESVIESAVQRRSACNWHGPGQRPPCRARRAGGVLSARTAQRCETGQGWQRLRGVHLCPADDGGGGHEFFEQRNDTCPTPHTGRARLLGIFEQDGNG